MLTRTPAGVVLALLLASAALSQPPAAVQPKDPPKTDLKDMPPPKGSMMTEYKWPTIIGGKKIEEWLKEATESPDPAVREYALKALPNFGPSARAVCSSKLIKRMAFPSERGEDDPGVRITLFDVAATLGFESAKDEAEAIRILGLTANRGQDGGLARLHAVRTLGLFGPKAEAAVNDLVGPPCNDPAYETRRWVANTLGRIAANETKGPNSKALRALSGQLARDRSAAVRMEALQSLVLLGPPWAAERKAGGLIPPIDTAEAKIVADNMRTRLGMNTAKKVPLETDKQAEIWCRLVLMRFDPKEINDDNLNALAQYLDPKNPDLGAKVQALQAIAILGEGGAKKIDDVIKLATIDDSVKDLAEVQQLVLTTALTALREMGDSAKPAIPALERLEKKLIELKEAKLKQEAFKKEFLALKKEDQQLVLDNMPEELLRKVVAASIKWIKDSKPGMPGGDRTPELPKKM